MIGTKKSIKSWLIHLLVEVLFTDRVRQEADKRNPKRSLRILHELRCWSEVEYAVCLLV
jgi:hypothetical protein